MAVKSTPVMREEVDYAEMCARLQVFFMHFLLSLRMILRMVISHRASRVQERISIMEGHMAQRLAEQQASHEIALAKATSASRSAAAAADPTDGNKQKSTGPSFPSLHLGALDTVLNHLSQLQASTASDSELKSWLSSTRPQSSQGNPIVTN